jgi:hypothetical protein
MAGSQEESRGAGLRASSGLRAPSGRVVGSGKT